jgi:hypothetical protein
MNKSPVYTGRNEHNKTTVDSDFLVKVIIVYFLVGKDSGSGVSPVILCVMQPVLVGYGRKRGP